MKQVGDIWFPHSDTHFERFMNNDGSYQRDTFDASMEYVVSPKLFYDVGAHVGLWSLMAHKAGFKSITSFEPNPETFKCLERNIGSFAKVWPLAIASERKTMSIKREHVDNSGAVRLEEGGDVLASRIDIENIHEMIAGKELRPHETLVKIDTEGMEWECVLGMDKILYALRPVICVEQRTNERALEILGKMGMKIVNQVRKDYILTWKDQ